jgi:predicted ATPase/class 3 adenylate cyclase
MTLPSGTVTFLFTDIEGSTKLAQQYPDAMPALLAQHHEILNLSIQAQNGYIFQIVGDSFSAAFHSAIDALAAALTAQRSLQSEAWTPAPIKVRMGIHTGTSHLNETSAPTVYSGYATLATTQRIMSAGHGGQILLSGAVHELVRDMLPSDSELQDLGEKRLKDLLRPEHLYQLNITGFPTTFPPLKTLDTFPNNLPTQLTSFIGRENEIVEVKQELDQHRLVTLTGSGGTGKTRLSLQVAADLLEKFDHGVWFAELAPLTDPDLIPQTILSTIGIQEQLGKTPLDVLKEYLHEKQTLIVLDNCEHLVSASAQVVNALLSAAPKLKVLASSREALGVKGEASYPVPSLSAPDVKHLPTIEQLSQYEAVRLFIDRALLVAPHFVVDKDNAPHIAQICYRLDGIPLAIELAAARIKMMSVEQISKRLDDRFRLLTGGARTALPRQQTLRALIDWSYDHLSENEQLLLRQLSVFAGGWTLEAVEEVCVGQDDILPYDILDLLTQLVNKSLVVVIAEGSQSGETRYRMLETIRQYAREKLLEAGGSEVIRDKHLAYFVKLAEQAESELYRSDELFWMNKLEDELGNFRVAVEWALAKDVKSGLQLIIAGRFFWEVRGDIQEVANWLAQLLEQYHESDSLHARALVNYGNLIGIKGDLTQAKIIGNQSLELSRAISDKHAEAFSLWGLGIITSMQGDVERGIPIVEQSLALYRSLGDKLGQANATRFLSDNNNDLELSKSFLFESLRLYRELGTRSGIASCLNLLALKAIWGGDFSSSVPWLEEAMAIHRQLGNKRGEAWVLENYGTLFYWQGDYENAEIYFEESITLHEKTGVSPLGGWLHVHLAYTKLQQGHIPEAKEMFERSVQNFKKANIVVGLVYTLEGIASLHVHEAQLERAAQLFAWADAVRDQIGDHRPPVEQASVDRDLTVIHSQISDIVFENAYENGKAMTTEQAIALAVEENS